MTHTIATARANDLCGFCRLGIMLKISFEKFWSWKCGPTPVLRLLRAKSPEGPETCTLGPESWSWAVHQHAHPVGHSWRALENHICK